MKFYNFLRFVFFLLTGWYYCKPFPLRYLCSLSLGWSEANKIDKLLDRLVAVEEKVDGFGKTLAELSQLIEQHLAKAGPMMILSNLSPNCHTS